MNRFSKVRCLGLPWLPSLLAFSLISVVPFLGCEVDSASQDCKGQITCAQKGLCGWDESLNRCVAKSEDDCRNSRFCLSLGECSLQNGRCIATLESDCRNSSECKVSKRCIPSGGECVEINPGYCRINNSRCKSHGECSLDTRGNTCIAKTDLDCASSDLCNNEGKCSIDSTRKQCVVKNVADCRQSELCAKEGRCNLGGEEKGRICVPLNHSDCKSSKDCQDKSLAKCAFSETLRSCENGDTLCRALSACQEQALCTWDSENAVCIIGSENDCKQSQLCSLAKLCKLQVEQSGRRCVRGDEDPCRDTPGCSNSGLCQQSGKECVPSSEADCQQSLRCLEEGLCKLSEDKKHCSLGDCSGKVCSVYGRCSKAKIGDSEVCRPKTEDDCKKSQRCLDFGYCTNAGNLCVKGGSP